MRLRLTLSILFAVLLPATAAWSYPPLTFVESPAPGAKLRFGSYLDYARSSYGPISYNSAVMNLMLSGRLAGKLGYAVGLKSQGWWLVDSEDMLPENYETSHWDHLPHASLKYLVASSRELPVAVGVFGFWEKAPSDLDISNPYGAGIALSRYFKPVLLSANLISRRSNDKAYLKRAVEAGVDTGSKGVSRIVLSWFHSEEDVSGAAASGATMEFGKGWAIGIRGELADSGYNYGFSIVTDLENEDSPHIWRVAIDKNLN